jgi:hypothetical protein
MESIGHIHFVYLHVQEVMKNFNKKYLKTTWILKM